MDPNAIRTASENTGIEPCGWANMQTVKAWITPGDGNWGFDENFHLRIEYANGRRLHLTDFDNDGLFQQAETVLAGYLQVVIDWRGPVWEAYQQYRAKSWLSKLLAGWQPPKITVYIRKS